MLRYTPFRVSADAAHRAMVSIGRSAPRSSSHQGSCSALVNWTVPLSGSVPAGRSGSRPPSIARGACPPVAPPASVLDCVAVPFIATFSPPLKTCTSVTLRTVARPGRTSRT